MAGARRRTGNSADEVLGLSSLDSLVATKFMHRGSDVMPPGPVRDLYTRDLTTPPQSMKSHP